MVLSRPQLAYLYYLEISLTVLQNYRINKSLKKHHRYIYWLFYWLGKIQSLWLFQSPKGNSKVEALLVKIFSIKKKSNFCFPRKQSMVPLDKGLQWVNVKQKPFRQI